MLKCLVIDRRFALDAQSQGLASGKQTSELPTCREGARTRGPSAELDIVRVRVRRRGLEEFTAGLIRRDLKLASRDQSGPVLHVVKPLIKNT